MGPGLKHDSGKNRLSLIQPEFIWAMGEVMTFGAQKYAARSWQKVESERYADALLRHIYRWLDGEQVDEESGLHHLAHAACNVMFLYWQEQEEIRYAIEATCDDPGVA